jgi:geranylgeranylglycerol-phosphate geranylgeranyltransferase
MIGLAVFTAALIGAGSDIKESVLPIFLGFSVAFLFGIAGNAINDYLDRETDKINHPDRPIPSGKLNPAHALYFSINFFIISLVLSFFLSFIVGYEVLLVVLIAFVSQIAYEKKFKHEKIIGNIIIGTQTALAFIFGGVIVGKTVITSIIAIAVFLSIVGREVVKDIEDIRGDKDRITLPMKIGVRKAGMVASMLIALAVLISPLPYYPLHQFGWEYLLVVSIADVLFIGSIPLIFRDARLARRVLKFAMLIAVFAFIIGSVFRG